MGKSRLLIIWFIGWITLALCILFFTNGLGDNGDGLVHYMFARYAHLHPENFLDPWAKTGFTLIAWPFAQLGLKGVMFMNIFSTAICLWLVFRISQLLKIEKAWVSFLILSLSTFYFKLMFSGLTEHLFSLVLTLVIYLLLKNKWLAATLLLSTLPFFRQEGYIIMASLVPFYIWKRQWKMFWFFPTSFIFVGLIGGIFYADLIWIVRSNPYGLHQSYGKGPASTFFNHLYYNIGLVNLLFFVMGIIFFVPLLFKSPSQQPRQIFVLIFLPFVAFFSSHAIFWTFGIFHSMGLQRVLNGVTPLVAIIGALGFSELVKWVPGKWTQSATIILTIVLIGFPFVPSPSNIRIQNDFRKNEFEKQMESSCGVFKTIYVQSGSNYIYFDHPLVPYYLNADPFDKTQYGSLFGAKPEELNPGAFIFWENGLTQLQTGFSSEMLMSYPNVEQVAEFETSNKKHRMIIFHVKENEVQ